MTSSELCIHDSFYKDYANVPLMHVTVEVKNGATPPTTGK